MATSEQLITSAHALAHGLEIEVETEDLDHSELRKLVADLNVRQLAKVAADVETTAVEGLLSEVTALTERLGAEPPGTEGFDRVALEELVKSLKVGVAEKEKADAETQGMKDATKVRKDAEAGAKRKAKKEADAVPVYEYYLMPGKAITSKRGILSDGDEVTPKDIGPNGKEILEGFVASGIIGKSE